MKRKSGRRVKSVLSIFMLVFLLAGSIGFVYADEAPDEEGKTEKTEETVKEEPLDLTLSLGVHLYRGDKVQLFASGLKKAQRKEVKTTNAKVAAISKNGVIKARRCGKAVLTLKLTYPSSVRTIRLNVKVTKCSYRSKKEISLYPGETCGISATSRTKGATVSLRSGKNRVLAISGKKLVAKAPGKSKVTASVTNGTKSASVSLLLAVVKKTKLKVTNAIIDKWFKGAIMAGHSVGIGFQMYCESQYNGFLGNALHLSTTSYGVYNDRAPVKGSSLHPVVNGRKARLKDHVKALGAKKVFINYGLNDIGMYGPEQFVQDYMALVNELLLENPQTTVYIVSTTPLFSSKGSLNNTNVRIANSGMQRYAKKMKRVEYIDVYTPLQDGSGRLREEYCSDAYCHMTFAGYKVYADTLKKFAKKKIPEEVDKKDLAFTKKEMKQTRKKL